MAKIRSHPYASANWIRFIGLRRVDDSQLK